MAAKYFRSKLYPQNSLLQIGLIQIIIVKNSFRQSYFPQVTCHQNSFRQNNLHVDFARLDDLYTQATGIVAWAKSTVESCLRKEKSLVKVD